MLTSTTYNLVCHIECLKGFNLYVIKNECLNKNNNNNKKKNKLWQDVKGTDCGGDCG